MNLLDQSRCAAEEFRLPGAITCIEAHGEGLIHDTFVVSTSVHGNPERFILQRINQQVFADPSVLMENTKRVLSHLQMRAIQSGRDPQREVLCLIRTKDGKTWRESEDQAWRMVRFVEGTTTVDRFPSVNQAYQIGSAFGRFLDDLANFPLETLRSVLPGYRDTERYLSSLWRILDQDPLDRAKDAHDEITFIESRVDVAMRVQILQRSGQIPLRVIHGDTKLNNVLLDAETGISVCVIDLDTVMPGLLLHDIGDCVREALIGEPQGQGFFTAYDLRIFEAIVTGFFSGLSTPLLPLEIDNIVAGVKSITLELGSRFLTDYLSGDIYFKTLHSKENLDRCGQHFQLLRRIEASEGELQVIVQRCAGEL